VELAPLLHEQSSWLLRAAGACHGVRALCTLTDTLCSTLPEREREREREEGVK
jgi:hypothetical protein